VDRTDVGAIAPALAGRNGVRGTATYWDLEVHVPRLALAGDAAGVLRQGAAGYLSRLGQLLGEIDTVWAETRSLLWGRAAEDVVVAYIRSLNGLEGALWVNALGTDPAAARLRIYEPGSGQSWCDTPGVTVGEAWRHAYRALQERGGVEEARPLTTEYLEVGLTMAELIERAARARRTVQRRELDR
jgi:hypothetical protein